MKRRQFTRNGSLALGSLFLLRCKAENAVKSIAKIDGGLSKVSDFGLQLWSVRDAMAENPIGTLKALSDIGYKDIESAGYSDGAFYKLGAKKFKAMLSTMGLQMRSTHTKTGNVDPKEKATMSNQWERVVNDAKEAGAKSIVCGWLHPDERKSIDDYKRLAELFNACGEKARSYDIKFGFHNHDFEFEKIDNEVPYDILLDNTSPENVFFELDHYWIKKGGASTFDYFSKYPGRFPVWHVKDMDDTKEQFFTEVGSGIIDYVEIFKKSKQAGLEYFYVEQDAFKSLDPLVSVKQSHDFLKKMEY